MRSLITGVSGFVGNHLVAHLLAQGDEVVGTCLPGDKPRSDIKTKNLDITNFSQVKSVLEDYQPEVIYHLAGIAFVPDCDKDFLNTLSINVNGVYNIFKASEELGLKTRIVLVSSFEVYGRFKSMELPLTEETPVRPCNNYSLSKIMAEHVARKFSRSWFAEGSDVDSVIVRPANHIGPGQRIEFASSNFAFQLAQIKQGKVEPTIKVGNLEAMRDFTDVRDIVRAYRLAAFKGRDVYNLCSGKPVAIQVLLDKLIEISGIKVVVEQDPSRMRPSDLHELYGSAKKAKNELGWEPTISLTDSLRDIYQYWSTN
jgi:GDP-4-dehydro-6-deoxy-D-mannose reductase